MELTVYSGRPASMDGRLEKEIRTYDLLDKLEIEYTRCDHDAAMTMEACLESDRALDVSMCKNLFLCNRQKTAFYLLMMPGEKPFKTKELSSQIGSARLSFASGEDMERLLDITPGSLSVLGLMNDNDGNVELLIDEDTLKDEYLGCHPCINTSSIKLKTADLINHFLPAVGHGYTVVKLIGEEGKEN